MKLPFESENISRDTIAHISKTMTTKLVGKSLENVMNLGEMTPDDQVELLASNEEKWFYLWAIEAQNAGLIRNLDVQPDSWELIPRQSVQITETKITRGGKETETTKDKFLFHPHKYTADYAFFIDKYFTDAFWPHTGYIVVDTKGDYMTRGSTAEFSINQKLMLQIHGIYVNKIIPSDLFKKTWVPVRCRYTPVKKDEKKLFEGLPGIAEFLRMK